MEVAGLDCFLAALLGAGLALRLFDLNLDLGWSESKIRNQECVSIVGVQGAGGGAGMQKLTKALGVQTRLYVRCTSPSP